MELAAAIPRILKRFPETRFVFAGSTERSPVDGLSMQAFLKQQLAAYEDRVTFLGRIAPENMSKVLAEMDICVLPSHWENFPNACLEAMSAGRGVVGSTAGGMAQQLDGGRTGLLVRPNNPEEISECVCCLLGNPEFRMELGRKARTRVQSEYNPDRIGVLTEDSYEQAIRQRQAGGTRWRNM
jgi:glycosyltransferase involved in cell wall biosynthesis